MSSLAFSTPVSRAARVFMALAAVLVATAGISLYALAEHTDTYFAWTIKPPATAAFLGAGYLSVATALLLGLREREWANVRVGVWVVATGLLAILGASLLHIDKFHLASPVPTAKGWAWSWMFLYVVLVPGLVATLWQQARTSRGDLPATASLPTVFRFSLRALGVLMLVLGAALYVEPATAQTLWPWSLTPLTARMVGSFYMAFGVSLLIAAHYNDYTRMFVASGAYIVAVVLHGINTVRYPEIDWSTPAGVLFAAVLAALFVVGAVGVRGYVGVRNKRGANIRSTE